MNVKRSELMDDDLRRQVVEAYQRGIKLEKIEREFGVARATIYWFLEQAGVSPQRMKRNVALAADKQTVADLYDVILEQETYVAALEAENAALREEIRRLT